MTSVGKARDEALALHPTVKPVAPVADALKDCSHRGDIVLDPFGGSGSTLIAAETCGRSARLLELDPLYCDTIITRWQQLTGQQAILIGEAEPDGLAPPERSHRSGGLIMSEKLKLSKAQTNAIKAGIPSPRSDGERGQRVDIH